MGNSQPKMTEQPKMSKSDQPPIQNSPPEDWAGWLESAEPAVKEEYNAVLNRLKVFLSDEMARQKAFERAWEFSQQLERKTA